MKLTKKILSEHGIRNSYNIAKKVGSKIFIDYVAADNGRLTSHSAYWQFVRLTEDGYAHKDFLGVHRDNKVIVLQEAVAYAKRIYNTDITDKDPFGAYHPKGTLEKLKALIKSEGATQE